MRKWSSATTRGERRWRASATVWHGREPLAGLLGQRPSFCPACGVPAPPRLHCAPWLAWLDSATRLCLPPFLSRRYKEEIEAQSGEGCHVWGELHINKARGRPGFCAWVLAPPLARSPCRPSSAAVCGRPWLARQGSMRCAVPCVPASPHSRWQPLLLPLACLQVAGNFHFAPGRSYQQGSMHIHDL